MQFPLNSDQIQNRTCAGCVYPHQIFIVLLIPNIIICQHSAAVGSHCTLLPVPGAVDVIGNEEPRVLT